MNNNELIGDSALVEKMSCVTEQPEPFNTKIQNVANKMSITYFELTLPILLLVSVYVFKVSVGVVDCWDKIKRLINDFAIDLILILYTYNLFQSIVKNQDIKEILIKTVLSVIMLFLCCKCKFVYDTNYDSSEGDVCHAIFAAVGVFILLGLFVYINFYVFTF